MLSDRCPVCPVSLSVCNVGAMWPNGWTDQPITMKFDMHVGLGPGHIGLDEILAPSDLPAPEGSEF